MKRILAALFATAAVAFTVATAAPQDPAPVACAFCWPTNR